MPASPIHVVASFLQFLAFCIVIWAYLSPFEKVGIPLGVRDVRGKAG